MDEKMMKILGGIIAGFVVFIIIIFLISSCSGKKYTYEKLEAKMLQVGKEYYEKNKNELPSEDGDTKVYTLKKMIDDGKIKELSKLFDGDVKCEGSVTVTNNDGFYNYSPYLNCGKDYKTQYLYEKIIEDQLVNTGIGLYEMADTYVMRGEVLNNYVQYGDKKYKIIRINEDNSIRLMEEKGLPSVAWDDRYNEDLKFTTGINEYVLPNNIGSRIKVSLEEYYKNEKVWPNELKSYIKTQTLCIGKRSKFDQTKDGSTECSVKLEGQKLGVLALYEYLQASLDASCDSSIDKNCRNYNWLGALASTSWTLTAETDRSNYAYGIYKTPTLMGCNNKSYVNAVFNLTDKAVYVEGDGSAEKPYKFR